MTTPALRRAFIALHLTLGVVILVESVQTALHAFGDHTPPHLHLGMLGSVEALAALLFLWPKTMKAGGVTLLAIFAIAIVAHAVQGEFQAALPVYAAAALFVTVHGSAWAPAH